MALTNSARKLITEVQQEILGLCMEALPLEQLESFESMLPGEEVPAASSVDGELYSFYDKLLPAGTIELLERLSELSYPILDPRDLAEQLGAQKHGLSPMEGELISNLNSADFPLPAFAVVYDAAIFRVLISKLLSCRRAYDRCMNLASRFEGERRDKEEADCRSQRDKCADKKLTAVFSVLVVQALIGRGPRVPGLGPWPPPPIGDGTG